MKLLHYFIVFTILIGSSCNGKKNSGSASEEKANEQPDNKPAAVAISSVSSASGSTLSGEATFTDNGDGTVSFNLSVKGVTPGSHAVHLHANGDCSAADAKSAGGHWNPQEVEHGKRGQSEAFHAGDIDNLMVGADSTGTLSMKVKGWTVGGAGHTNVIGKAIIIHAVADDFVSQPSGAAGPRIGCGVITAQ